MPEKVGRVLGSRVGRVLLSAGRIILIKMVGRGTDRVMTGMGFSNLFKLWWWWRGGGLVLLECTAGNSNRQLLRTELLILLAPN